MADNAADQRDHLAFLDAILAQGLNKDSHHATLKKAVSDLSGHVMSSEDTLILRGALEKRVAEITPEFSMELTKKKVCIVGFTTHRIEAFKLGDDWEIWGINELHRHHDPKLFDRWFEIHPRSDFEPGGNDQPGDLDHLKTLATFPIPVYMHQHWDDMPASVRFPKEEIEAFHNDAGRRGGYQTNSISWEVAMALMMGAEEIAVVGVDMANNTEYAQERPCLEYWIGIAEAVTGKRVYLPETSDLLCAVGQYGFMDEGNKLRNKMEDRLSWLNSEHNKRLAARRKLEAEYQQLSRKMDLEISEFNGGIGDCAYMIRSWMGGRPGQPGNPTPDRTKDPRTGITGGDNGE